MSNRLNVQAIMAIRPQELLINTEMAKIALEAQEHVEVIRNSFRQAFGIGEDRLEVWCDREGANHEYITHSGVWEARYVNQKYDVACNLDAVYALYRGEYLINHKIITEADDGFYKANTQHKIAGYFRSFVERLQRPNEVLAKTTKEIF